LAPALISATPLKAFPYAHIGSIGGATVQQARKMMGTGPQPLVLVLTGPARLTPVMALKGHLEQARKILKRAALQGHFYALIDGPPRVEINKKLRPDQPHPGKKTR